jgi:ABC-2 type transport system ATP-binding protein
MKPVLTVDNLRKRFGKILAVDGVSFDVKEGEIFGILGPNGAGKSTTLAMITGLVRADAGTVQLHGFEIRKNYREAVKNLGVLLENPGFYWHLSAFDNLWLFGRFKESSPAEIHSVLQKVGLGAHSKTKVKSFSQGMRKRLGLANALLGNPGLLILDEPTNSLDPKGAKVILDLIKGLSTEKSISIVISSNLLYDIEAVCDRALLIDKGRVVFCESVRDLLRSGEASYLIRIEPIEKARLMLLTLNGVKSAEYADEKSLRIVLVGLSPAELNRQLVEHGFNISELNPIKKTLQELFLQLKG